MQGARVNNLKDISLEIPKRRLTVFTGVSGSGKSSLVFATIAAESQRLINETYSGFVQGFMPTQSRPDVDVLDGLTTAITVERGDGRTQTKKATYNRLGGMCPRCEGRGSVTDFDLSVLYDADKPISKYTRKELRDLLYREPAKIKVEGINLTYTGLIPQIQKSFLAKDRESMQPHIGAFVDRAVTFATCPDCAGTRLSVEARSSTVGGITIADACSMQISDLATWVHQLDEPSPAPLLTALSRTLDSFGEIGLGYLSLDRPSGTLSGGEAQRTKMIRHLGSSLTDVTYVFDEPSIGLHPHDIQRMNELLVQLRDKGNTVLVVEHKPEVIAHHQAVMAHADWIIDLGPGAGHDGGHVVFEGTPAELVASRSTATGKHLASYVDAVNVVST